jgi:putative FmdB family regulatory protein
MPTYDYECPDCGRKFEVFQSISAKPVKVCPECGKRRVKRLIGAGAGLIFKGSGFYLTDYARAGGKAGGGEGGESKGGGDAKSGGESKAADAKPKPKAKD